MPKHTAKERKKERKIIGAIKKAMFPGAAVAKAGFKKGEAIAETRAIKKKIAAKRAKVKATQRKRNLIPTKAGLPMKAKLEAAGIDEFVNPPKAEATKKKKR